MSAAESSNYKAWLAKPENDFTNIENHLAANRVPWDTVCFHAQQAAQKVPKALLVFHGRVARGTHDLVTQQKSPEKAMLNRRTSLRFRRFACLFKRLRRWHFVFEPVVDENARLFCG